MGFLESLDSGVTGLVGQWNGYTTGLVTLLVAVVTYRLMSSREPDVHPMLLARQATAATVRNEGESAVYRGQAAPHGMPLNGGLNVKDAGVSKWSRGRDGDLRDIWRKAAASAGDGAKGRVLTVLGSENVVEHRLEDITRQINIIGRHIADQGGIKVAIYLPNSVELLVALLACSFYSNLTTVLIPFDVSDDELTSMLRRSAVDTVVTAPGAFPFDAVVKAYPSLRQLIWVADEGSSHMDWNEVPEGMGGSVNVATWQDIINDAPASAGTELPPAELGYNPQDVVTFWQSKPGQLEEMVRFTQANLVSGIAGQIAAIPTKERLSPSDLFLPADSLANIHTLILTLTALYSNASVAFNSVAGRSPDLVLATQGIAPTVLVASPATLLRTHQESTRKLGSPLARLSHSLSSRNLTQDGVLVTLNALSAFASGARPAIGTTPGKLRLVVIYALAAPRVAGAVSQTSFFDYRVDSSKKAHFGAPLTSVEILLRDKGAHKTTDDVVEGEIVARGPCVSGGEASTGVVGKIRDDNTLSYV
ncbi:hypothetical protein TOPH_01640 [Tolypocladium ophioglossoides CBS 100239]|uniref:AMP-dependent synthetase/ligase domain-containing protein n=1 Tax=Tolypocladium ophioglossoides (strain CBS 100239) TaxID=1163406 RepID=A0A0L0NI65_TOLOC|nr:hypothetical protein TOPH_01640 [Tolypocladium ophioglossoides CBS 100239]